MIKLVIGIILILAALFLGWMFMKNSAKLEAFQSNTMMTYYYMPSCPWCKKFNPVWEKFEEKVKSDKIPVVTRKVDATDPENEEEVAEQGIKGFPHVQKEDGKGVKVFEGKRTVEELVNFASS